MDQRYAGEALIRVGRGEQLEAVYGECRGDAPARNPHPGNPDGVWSYCAAPMLLIASYSGAFGGAERLLLDFAQAFPESCAIACPAGPLADGARGSGFRVFLLRSRSPRFRGEGLAAVARLVAHGAELRRLVRDLDPEVVVAWGMRSAIASLLGPGTGRPVVFQHNDLLPGFFVGQVVRAAAVRADLSIAPSYAIATDLDPNRRLRQRLHVVHPGVDVERFHEVPVYVRPPEVLVLGAIAAWKRPDLALEACALARRSYPGLRLRLVGGPLDQEGERLLGSLRAQASSLGFVELPGPVAEPAHELSRASCLLHCAEQEPFGMAVLEALAAGRPAVVPAAAGPVEIVDGTCGLLYRPGDAHAAADALCEVLGDPARAARLGAAGRERARRHFDLGRARQAYSAAVAPLLRPRGDHLGPPGRLAVVTVTHNSAAELRELVASMRRHLPGVRLVIVDCDSRDDTVAVAEGADFAHVIALGENVGFGRGTNRGLRAVTEPVAALVNPDVEFVDGSLLGLVEEALRTDRLLAPLVLYPDGSRQDTVHPVPTATADLARSVVPAAALPRPVAVPLAPWRARSPRRVGWAVACALVARTDVLRGLGPFDERIFLYGEDLDLGLAARERGIETWFWPSARVIHHRAHATARAFAGEPFELLARARHDVVARRLGARRARLDDAAQALTFASRAFLKRLLGRQAERERRQLEALTRVAGRLR
jgi:N-acetylglucosaminyl-diphospho-decaprenol L-rhamnosyltransferase